MTSSSEADGGALPTSLRRLHPLSWFFVLLGQLRQFAIPLVALLLFGRGGDWQELAAGFAAIAMALLAVWRYFTYTYRVDPDALVIRSGLLQRGVRHLPFRRIHNVELRQSPLHRVFAVAEVRIESATGDREAEAQMQVLALADARALVGCIRGGREASTGDAATPADPSVLAEVPTRDLVLLGLSSNRGWIAVGALMAVAAQIEPGSWSRKMPNAVIWISGHLRALDPGLGWAFAAGALLLLAMALVRLLGVVIVLLRHYGFRLSEEASRLGVESGLLTRTHSHTSLAKIQRWQVREPWLLRRAERRALHVETAARHAEGSERGIDALLPVGPSARIESLLRRWLPGVRWERADWHPIHPRAWRRMVKPPLALLAGLTLALAFQVGVEALLLPLLLAPLVLLGVRRDAAFCAFSVDAERVLWRHGWLQRRWDIIERERIQAVRLRQSPFDRRSRMAHVDIDSAGARSGITRLAFLPEAEAERIVRQLRRWLSTPRLFAPEGRGEQHQHGEHFQPAEQHAQGAQPDGAVADRAEGSGDFAKPGAEIGERGDTGTKG